MFKEDIEVGMKVRFRSSLASGPIDTEAIITKHVPPSFEGDSPIIWIRPKKFKHDVSVTLSDIEEIS